MDTLIHKILDSNQSIIKDTNKLLKQVSKITTNKTEKYLSNIEESVREYEKVFNYINLLSLPNTIDTYFEYINAIELSLHIIGNIYSTLEKLINKTQISDVYLSQTYVSDTFELYKKVLVLYKKFSNTSNLHVKELINNIILKEINSITTDSNIYNYVLAAQKLFKQYPFTITLYCELISKLLKYLERHPEHKIIYFDIFALIENDKDLILKNIDLKKFKKINTNAQPLNPYYNAFSLIPNTESIPINEISMIIFQLPAKDIDDFIKICKVQKYGLIIMNKHILHPITYNYSSLLNFEESNKFKLKHNNNYGVNIPLIKRYDTIKRLDTKSKWKFSINTHVLTFNNYEQEKDLFVIILDSLGPSTYRIMTNYLSVNKKYFVRVSSIRELYMYCNNLNILQPTRINSFNSICINNALDNMYAPIKIDMDKIKVISTIVDPKYLKNQIYLRILEEFKRLINTKYKNGADIKSNYTYSLIVKNEEFLNIFSNIIIEEFHTFLYSTYTEYVSGFINISEILCTFINDIYIYQRMFVKEVHDYFKDNLLKFEDGEITVNNIISHFDSMIQTALTKIIAPDSNIYQNVLYKINLLKNSLL